MQYSTVEGWHNIVHLRHRKRGQGPCTTAHAVPLRLTGDDRSQQASGALSFPALYRPQAQMVPADPPCVRFLVPAKCLQMLLFLSVPPAPAVRVVVTSRVLRADKDHEQPQHPHQTWHGQLKSPSARQQQRVTPHAPADAQSIGTLNPEPSRLNFVRLAPPI